MRPVAVPFVVQTGNLRHDLSRIVSALRKLRRRVAQFDAAPWIDLGGEG